MFVEGEKGRDLVGNALFIICQPTPSLIQRIVSPAYDTNVWEGLPVNVFAYG